MKNNLKNIIKETVDNHSDDINPDMIWAGIESKLGKKKKRRFTGYWMLLGGLSLVATLVVYTFVWSSEDSSDKSSALNYVNNTEINESVIESETIGEIQSISDVQGVNRNQQKEFVENGGVDLNNVEDLASKGFKNNKGRTVVSKRVAINQESSKSNDTFFSNEKSIDLRSNYLVGVQKVEEVIGTDDLSELKSRESFSISTAKPITHNKLIVNDREIKIDGYEEFVFDVPYNGVEDNFSLLSGIEIYSGVSFGNKSVTDIDQSYAKVRNESEQLLEQWSAGVRFDLLKVMDFQLQSGVRYSVITDRMEIVNEYKDLNEYTYVKSRLVDGAIVVIDSMVVVDSIPQVFAYTTQQYNSQRIVSIPLEISFGKRVGQFDLGLGFGVDVNYQLADTHVILDEDGKASVNKVGGKLVSPSFSGSLLSRYYLNDKWSITSRVSFRGLSLSDHQSISSLRSNYRLYGLEVGLKRNFGW